MLLDEATLRKINRLVLVSEQVRAGLLRGERRSTRRGTSLEFADYRAYSPGEDLRRVDWNAYARLDRPFLKLFEEEEDLAVHLLVDASQSMDWGMGEENKFAYALKLAAALGAIALAAGDRVQAALLRSSEAEALPGPLRGQPQTLRLLHSLENSRAGGQTNINRAIRSYAAAGGRPGLAILVSDLLSPGGYLEGLTELQGRGYELVLIHLLSPEELDPPLAGDLRLADAETGTLVDVSLDRGLRDRYRLRVQAWRQEVLSTCRRRGLRCLSIQTNTPWDRVVLQEMRQAHILR